MHTLVLPLPDRPRSAAAGHGANGTGFDWLLLDEAGQLLSEGHDQPDALPPSDQLVLLLADRALSWHCCTLPRTGRQRWRAALVGLLEESLLEDPESLHMAIEPHAAAGGASWVAVTPKAPLAQAIEALENAQRTVDRIVPRWWPSASAQGHFFMDEAGLCLCLAGADGVTLLPLSGGFARTRTQAMPTDGTEWTASAEAVQAAEQWLGGRVAASGLAQQAARALASPWDLRQFDLAPRLRGMRWLRQLGRQGLHRQWRAARTGLLVWAGLCLLALNLGAWQQRQLIAQRQQNMQATLKAAFPHISYVVEPAVQMQKEITALRAQGGALGEQDFESLIGALSLAWPSGHAPVESLRFESGQLSLPRSGWSDAQLVELRRTLASEGWQLDQDQGQLTLRRASP